MYGIKLYDYNKPFVKDTAIINKLLNNNLKVITHIF